MSPSHRPKSQQSFLSRLCAMVALRCHHPNLSWPMSRWEGPEHHRRKRTYRVCTDCGREFEYRGELITS